MWKYFFFYNGTITYSTGNQSLKWGNITADSGYAYTELAFIRNHYQFDGRITRKPFLFEVKRVTDDRFSIVYRILEECASEVVLYEFTDPLHGNHFYGMSATCVLPLRDKYITACPNNSFTCKDRSCIARHRRCDYNRDCIDGSDEMNCTTHSGFICCNLEDPLSVCHNRVALSNLCDGISQCNNNMDEICNGSMEFNKLIPLKQIVFTTSPPLRKEFIIWLCQVSLERFGGFGDLRSFKSQALHYIELCTPDSFCGTGLFCPGTHECVRQENLCIHRKGHKQRYFGYPNGHHLLGCEDFQCSGYFKCHSSYCIPVNYVCDGQADCILGEDEHGCSNMSCPELFKCSAERHCLPQSLVCNGEVDCPLTAEDELLCHLCQDQCECTAHAAVCNAQDRQIILPEIISTLIVSGFTKTSSLSIPGVIYLDVSNNLLSILKFAWGVRVKYLVASWCDIQFISGYSKTQSLIERLKIDHNIIQQITQYQLYDAPKLQYIDLSHNQIKILAKNGFVNLFFLSHLLLSHNPLLLVYREMTFPYQSVKLYVSEGAFCCAELPLTIECLVLSGRSQCQHLIEYIVVTVTIAVLSTIIICENFHIEDPIMHHLLKNGINLL